MFGLWGEADQKGEEETDLADERWARGRVGSGVCGLSSLRAGGFSPCPLDEELALLPGKLTPREHERLARLAGWVSFEHAV